MEEDAGENEHTTKIIPAAIECITSDMFFVGLVRLMRLGGLRFTGEGRSYHGLWLHGH